MYKTISIHSKTYQNLNALAKKLQKPKSQLIHDLIQDYIEKIQEEEKNSLKTFNSSVKRLSKHVKLPRGTKINLNESELLNIKLIPDLSHLKLEKRKVTVKNQVK